ncbi:MAG: ABC transporter substrate-binding protein [Ignavibacteria bacterium]|nr:ABC transporter substrate-binding protein [Ignavibacteria bacterium]
MKKIKLTLLTIAIFISSTLLISCGSKDNKTTTTKTSADTKPISIKQFDTPPGADPSVSAEMGGNGFTGEGWTTNTDYNYLGDPKAVKGGSISWSIPDFPASLRQYGKDENSYYTRMMQNLVYESLLSTDPVNEDYAPRLASHWQVSPDKKTYRFRINPNARWADGKPVTSEDVIATWKLATDPGLLSGTGEVYMTYLSNPVAESKYIVTYKAKKDGWLPLSIASGIRILPAHIIGNISAKDYLDKFNYEVVPGSGPYYVRKEDVDKGRSVTLRRRSDYWAEKERWATGLNNFDIIKTEVIQDETLMYEKFKKGETDVYSVNRAQWWAEKTDFDEVKQGTVMKKRIFNQNPAGLSGLAFNMRKPPFDDLKVRKAFQMLFDRVKYNEKLFYKAYKPTKSNFPATPYENPNNPLTGFNLDSAIALLEEAGWKDKNSEGYRMKNGSAFEVDLTFTQPSQERYFTVFQEDLKKAGVKLNLKQVDGTTQFKIGNQRNFSLIPVAWGGQNPPSHEFNIASKTANDTNSTNWPGFASKDIDQLVERYNITDSKEERVALTRQMDSIIYAMQPYVYGWYADYVRLMWHNKFGYPKWIVSRFDDYYSGTEQPVFAMWWLDPAKDQKYMEAIKDKSKKLPTEEVDNSYWLELATRENKGEKIKLNQ